MLRPPACRRSGMAWHEDRARTWLPYGGRPPRRQPSYGIEPALADRVALARQQRGDFIERKADDVAVRAYDLDDECPGDALRGVTAGLAAPFARGQIGLDIALRQSLEAHAGLDQSLPIGFFRRHQADRSVDAMITAGQQTQALGGFVDQLGLGQDAPADRNHGIGGEDISALPFFAGTPPLTSA